MKILRFFLPTILSLILGLIICLCLAMILGEDPSNVLNALVLGAFGSSTNIGYTLFYATPLIFTGLAVIVAFQAGLFNIGCEGQLYIGSLILTFGGIFFKGLPSLLAVPLGIAAAMVGGAIWGGLTGALKAYRGSHEVIVTIMLNFIAYSLCGFFIMNIFKNPASQNPESMEIDSSFYLNHFSDIFLHSPVNTAFFIAIASIFIVWFLLYNTRWGFEIRLAGRSVETARRSGVPTERRILEAMILSGALAGLVGVNEIMGFAHKFRDQFSAGYGFTGIAVALLARRHPYGVLPAALIFGALQKGALDLEIDTNKITRDMAGVMQGVIILFVATEFSFQKFSNLIRKIKS